MRRFLFPLLLLVLALLCGYLLSKASLIGRAGMTYVYPGYAFLKVWWQGALFTGAVWLILFTVLYRTLRYRSARQVRTTCAVVIVLALAGLLLTYQDFRHTLSHRLLGERFHLGGYLFWIGIILTGAYGLGGGYRSQPASNP